MHDALVMCNRSHADRLRLIRLVSQFYDILANRRNQPKGWSRSAAKILRIVPRSLRSLCFEFEISDLSHRNLKVPRSVNFVYLCRWLRHLSHKCLVLTPRTHTLVANLRFAPFSRSPAWAISAEMDAAAHKVTSWPTRVRGCILQLNHLKVVILVFGEMGPIVNGVFHRSFWKTGSLCVRIRLERSLSCES